MFDAILNVSKAVSSKSNKEYTYVSVMGLCPDGSYIEVGRLFPTEMELKGIENTLKKGVK